MFNLQMHKVRKGVEMNDLIIIRGLPGSGKTTYAREKYKDYVNYEADMYHTKNGVYVYKKENAGAAHNECLTRVAQSLKNHRKVVVSNTFTTQKEIDAYIKLATELGKTYCIIRMTKQYGSIHGVPQSDIDKMKNRMVDIPGEVLV
jgi:predicted kinase